MDTLTFKAFSKYARQTTRLSGVDLGGGGQNTVQIDPALGASPVDNAFEALSDREKNLLSGQKNLGIRQMKGNNNALYLSRRGRSSIGNQLGGKGVGGKTLVYIPQAKSPSLPLIGKVDRSHLLAHELGHREFEHTGLGKILQHPRARSIAPRLGVLGALGRGVYEGQQAAKNEAEGKKGPGHWSAGIGAVSQIPQLGSEFAASAHGHRLLRRAGADAAERKVYRKSMGKAFSTYAAHSALGALGIAGAGEFARHLSHDERKNRVAP